MKWLTSLLLDALFPNGYVLVCMRKDGAYVLSRFNPHDSDKLKSVTHAVSEVMGRPDKTVIGKSYE